MSGGCQVVSEDALVLSGEGFMATLLLSVVPDIWGVLGDG